MLGADDYNDSLSDDEYCHPNFEKTRRPTLDGSSNDNTAQYGLSSHEYVSRTIPSSSGEVSGYINHTKLSPGHRQDSPRSANYGSSNHRNTHSSTSQKHEAEQKRLLGKRDQEDEYITCKKRTCVQIVFIAFALIFGLSGWTTFTIFKLKYRQNTDPILASCSEWSPWGTCTVTCGVGTQTRLRKCQGNSSYYWEADYHDSQGCTQPVCEASCSDWSIWGECSVTCGVGTQIRHRTCEGNSSLYWVADYHDSQGCTQPICKAKCDDWSDWGECSVTCGQGNRVRTRKCYGNSSQYWESVFHDSEACTQPICTGTWGIWNSWGSCDVTCGCGVRTRDRNCSNEYCGSDYKDYLSCSYPSCNGGRSSFNQNALWIISYITSTLLTVVPRLR